MTTLVQTRTSTPFFAPKVHQIQGFLSRVLMSSSLIFPMPVPESISIQSLLLSPPAEARALETPTTKAPKVNNTRSTARRRHVAPAPQTPPRFISVHRTALPVQIPRLTPKSINTHLAKWERTSRACTSCRSKKIKCSGEESRCRECIKSGVECVYDKSRRDRLKHITDQNAMLMNTLKELSTRVDEGERARILNLLQEIEQPY